MNGLKSARAKLCATFSGPPCSNIIKVTGPIKLGRAITVTLKHAAEDKKLKYRYF